MRFSHSLVSVQGSQLIIIKRHDRTRHEIPTSLHSLRLTKRLSGVGKKISVEHNNMLFTQK